MNIHASMNHKPVIVSENYGRSMDGLPAPQKLGRYPSVFLKETRKARQMLPPEYGEMRTSKRPNHR